MPEVVDEDSDTGDMEVFKTKPLDAQQQVTKTV